tara:strand:- start:809 stop:940 length:132 start_codon:yes stop_codon:yes gene_type:complete
MKRIVFITLLTLLAFSCGKKGSLEFPTQNEGNGGSYFTEINDS